MTRASFSFLALLSTPVTVLGLSCQESTGRGPVPKTTFSLCPGSHLAPLEFKGSQVLTFHYLPPTATRMSDSAFDSSTVPNILYINHDSILLDSFLV